MVECLECGDKFDKDNAPLCEAYDWLLYTSDAADDYSLV
jgi:hypothetical protein